MLAVLPQTCSCSVSLKCHLSQALTNVPQVLSKSLHNPKGILSSCPTSFGKLPFPIPHLLGWMYNREDSPSPFSLENCGVTGLDTTPDVHWPLQKLIGLSGELLVHPGLESQQSGNVSCRLAQFSRSTWINSDLLERVLCFVCRLGILSRITEPFELEGTL